MLPILPYLQDIAGQNCSIAPFAQTSPKNIFFILCSVYNPEGELVQIIMSDYSQTQGKLLGFKESDSVYTITAQDYKYDKNGVVKMFSEIGRKRADVMTQKRLRYKEIYNDGFLAIRKDSKLLLSGKSYI